MSPAEQVAEAMAARARELAAEADAAEARGQRSPAAHARELSNLLRVEAARLAAQAARPEARP